MNLNDAFNLAGQAGCLGNIVPGTLTAKAIQALRSAGIVVKFQGVAQNKRIMFFRNGSQIFELPEDLR